MRVGGGQLRWFFLASRLFVLGLMCLTAVWSEYLNLKVGYNNARLVDLAHGPWVRRFYDASDWFFGQFGDPLEIAQSSGGMVWSSTILGLPLTDPVAGLSVAVNGGPMPGTFLLGLVIPVGVALLLGRVFCAGVCPASLVFFVTSRVRRLLRRWFYLPNLKPGRGFAWGILVGGLLLSTQYGHGIWTLILPYFAMGQALFHSIAFQDAIDPNFIGIVKMAGSAFILLVLGDLLLGDHFVCRYVCPTGRLLGAIGRGARFRVKREAAACLESCNSCTQICPIGADPKVDNLVDCSLCGECLSACPSQCLTVGKTKS